MKDTILAIGVLEVAIPNIQSMNHEEYALARKDYFGASDSSILCGVNLYKTMEQLIVEKNAKYITKEEKEVGEKAIVRKGYDLEPIILAKAEEELQTKIFKPEDMFKFKDVEGLSVNYDGVTVAPTVNKWVPVEAKLVSKYGEKYYSLTTKFFKKGTRFATLCDHGKFNIGIYIDIFVFDFLAEDKKERVKQIRIANLLRKLYELEKY